MVFLSRFYFTRHYALNWFQQVKSLKPKIVLQKFIFFYICRRILIDTGDADVPQYINHLKSVLHYEEIDLAHIFVTHRHHDHIGGLKDIFEGIEDKTSK